MRKEKKMTEVRGQKAEERKWNGEWGLRPVGGIGAYAPEGRQKAEMDTGVKR